MIKFSGFSPDLDPSTEGVMLDCNNVIPSPRGVRGAPSAQSAGYAALGSTCKGVAVIRKLDNTKRIFAATSTDIYEGTGGTWTNRGTGYSATADNLWSFAQFGDATIAAAKTDTMQASTGAGFSAIATAPKARYIDVSGGFVMAADTNDGTFGDQPDRWWCSAYLAYNDWTPAVATQCVSGRLVDVPGPITALKAFGSGFVAYKNRGMFVANYVGAPAVWSWQQVPGEIGCSSNNVVVNVGTAHVFMGAENFYYFDGSRPQPIGNPLRNWFYAQLNAKYAYKCHGAYDRISGNVWFFYPSNASSDGTCDKAVVYNLYSQMWGKVTIGTEASVQYLTGGVTYDSIGSLYTTWDSLPTGVSYDSPYWTAESPSLAVVDTTHTLQTLTASSVSSYITTGNYGDDENFTTITRVRPRFYTAPTSSTFQYMYDLEYGDSFTNGNLVSLADGKYDVLWSSRWHRGQFNMAGDYELAGFQPYFEQSGSA